MFVECVFQYSYQIQAYRSVFHLFMVNLVSLIGLNESTQCMRKCNKNFYQYKVLAQHPSSLAQREHTFSYIAGKTNGCIHCSTIKQITSCYILTRCICRIFCDTFCFGRGSVFNLLSSGNIHCCQRVYTEMCLFL